MDDTWHLMSQLMAIKELTSQSEKKKSREIDQQSGLKKQHTEKR